MIINGNLNRHFKLLNTGYWDIQGLSQKTNRSSVNKHKDKEFLDTIDNLDLFCLGETHINSEFSTNLKWFKSYKSCRQTSGNNKFSGRLCLFIYLWISLYYI